MSTFIGTLIEERSSGLTKGFIIGWIISTAEYLLTATAWGGPFPILMLPVAAAFISGVSVVLAFLLGLLLRLPLVRDAWRRAGDKVLFLAMIPVAVLVFSSLLGLREIDPVSGYSLLSSPWVATVCYVSIVFPFVNRPIKPPAIPAQHQLNHDA